MDPETQQILRDLYPTPDDERFYARALEILSRPRRLLRTIGLVANIAVYAVWVSATAFLIEQAWDRAQVPVEFVRAWADPRQVVSGTPVRQWVEVVRHKRCTYQTTWSVTDARDMVSYFGPVTQVAPGPPGPAVQPPFGIEFSTPRHMAPGPATLRVTLRGECPGNYLDNWWPVEIEVPPVRFEAVEGPHDAAPVSEAGR